MRKATPLAHATPSKRPWLICRTPWMPLIPRCWMPSDASTERRPAHLRLGLCADERTFLRGRDRAAACLAPKIIDGQRARQGGERCKISAGSERRHQAARNHGSDSGGGTVQQQQGAASGNHLSRFELIVDVRDRQRIEREHEAAEQRRENQEYAVRHPGKCDNGAGDERGE